jgi:hypothetical protein
VKPPVRNHVLSPAHESFVSTEIYRELRVGAIRRWGKVGSVKPPRLVYACKVEPSKPRKLSDGRFLNLWCKDSPFDFEELHMLPALVDTGGYGYNVNDVSGYFHVHRTARSGEFFGFEWQGVYCCTQLLTLDGSKSLVGKLGAIALAAPGILMKLRRCYKALAVASRSPSTVLRDGAIAG